MKIIQYFKTEPMQKPISLSIICWFLIISSVITLFLTFSQESREYSELMGVPVWYGLTQSLLTSLLLLVSAVAMLKRKQWGRTLYLVFYPIPILISFFVIDNLQLALVITGFGIAIYLVLLYLLFRQDVSDFFKGQYSPDNVTSYPLKRLRASQRAESITRRVFAIIAFIIAGIFLLLITLSFSFFDDPFGLTVFSVIMGTPAAILLLLGTFLWGMKRWAESIGWLLCGLGAYSFFSFLGFKAITSGILPVQEVQPLDPEVMHAMTQGSFTGVFYAIIGIGLLVLQYNTDKESLSTEHQ